MAYKRPGVYINERLLPSPIAAPATANAVGAAIGKFPKGPTGDIRLVRDWSEFTSLFGGYSTAYPATFGVSQYFANGGSQLYVRRVLGSGAAVAQAIIKQSSGSTTVATATATSKGADFNNYRLQLTQGAAVPNVSGKYYYTLTVTYDVGVADTLDGTPSYVTAGASDDVVVESYANVRFDDANSPDYISTVVNNLSSVFTIAVSNLTLAPDTTNIIPFTGGSDGSSPIHSDYTAVLGDFDKVGNPLVVFAPEIINTLGSLETVSGTMDYNKVQAEMLKHFTGTNHFVVLDTPSGLAPGTAITNTATLVTSTASLSGVSNAAVYYPNIYITDPLGRNSSSTRLIGPAGSVAGRYIATDIAVGGPFKAPAGISAGIQTGSGLAAVERRFTSDELDTMNSASFPVNPIRSIPGAGVVIMGARTLQQDNSPNRYVSMRRSLNYLKQSLNDLTQFALFQNNDATLWAAIRTTLDVFLNQYRNKGGLAGATPADAYYIKCDSSNNTPATIANGEIHIEVGVALEYPAEFVVINLSQITNQ